MQINSVQFNAYCSHLTQKPGIIEYSCMCGNKKKRSLISTLNRKLLKLVTNSSNNYPLYQKKIFLRKEESLRKGRDSVMRTMTCLRTGRSRVLSPVKSKGLFFLQKNPDPLWVPPSIHVFSRW